MSTTAPWRMRFSLRTFLLAFSAVAVWLGWNVFLVDHRKQVLSDLGKKVYVQPLNEGYEIPTDGKGMVELTRAWNGLPMGAVYAEPTSPQQLSWIRRRLGDKPYLYLSVYDPELIPTIRRWFPEAVCVRRMVISNVHRQMARNSRE
jgi:hypothetical protein